MVHVNGRRASTDGYALLLAVAFDRSTLGAVRQNVRDLAARCTMTGDRLDDFVVAVNEIMINAVRHAGGAGYLQLWRGEDLLCEVMDHGSGFDPDPYFEGEKPQLSPSGGMGLWLARQTSDNLSVDSGPTGTIIGIQSRLAAQSDT